MKTKVNTNTIKHTTFMLLANTTLSRKDSDGRPQDRHTNSEHTTFTRQDIHRAIWVAQGKDIKTYVVRQGNYATAIKSWTDDEKLLERVSRGLYRLSDNGFKFGYNTYEDGVKLIRSINENKIQERRKAVEERNNLPHFKHAKEFQHLVGLSIVKVRYCTPEERNGLGWYNQPIILHMSDGSLMFPQTDDEGNDGGALALFNDRGNSDCAYTINELDYKYGDV